MEKNIRALVSCEEVDTCWECYKIAIKKMKKSLKMKVEKIHNLYYCFIWCTDKEWENIKKCNFKNIKLYKE